MSRAKQAYSQTITEPDAYLLQVCLGQDRETIQTNLAKWKAEQDFNLIDIGAYRLVPVLQKQLSDFQVEDPNLPIYKGIYKKCWMKNKRLFNDLVKICCLLQSNGIPVLVLKGVALSVLYYKDNGIRPMDDADIWVPFDKLEQALAIFHDHGWYSKHRLPDETVLKYQKYLKHSTDYQNDEEFYIDIHWKPVDLASSPAFEQEVWRNTQPMIINGVELQTLTHEFHFFHVVVHGVRWNAVSSIRWIVDAITILRSAGSQFNWEELITLAEKYHAIVFIREAIHYLAATYDAPIPGWVQETIAKIPVTAVDKAEYRALSHKSHFYNSTYYTLFVYYLKLRAVSENWEQLPFLPGYMKYLCLKMEVDSAWQLTFALPKKTIFYLLTKMKVVQRQHIDR